ncbi:MAG: multicopper oxidase family protein [Bradymonadaceae bacterium]|nr:multicopper oxidase family protein [Lujinxingiaceae bacterium]
MKKIVRCVSLAAAALTLLSACMGNHGDHSEGHGERAPSDVVIVPASEGPWALVPLKDVNADPDVVEVHLEARIASFEYRPGKHVEAWTYNGLVPGPLIEAKVGDRVIVHFTNSLTKDTTVHWHGQRITAAMDGTLAMQNAIKPGDSFTYDFVVQDEGLYWYHPHMNADEQVARGLYGALVVRGPGDDAVEVASEELIVLHDMHIDENNKIVLSADMASLMSGREGNYVFANGRLRPIKDLKAGERHRLRIVNAASARFFRLALPGHSFHKVATDGHLLEAPVELDEVLLTPGERVDLIVTATGAPASQVDLMSLPYERGHGTGAAAAFPLITLRYSAHEPVATPALPATLASFAPLAQSSGSVELVLSEDPMDHGDGGHGGHAMDPVFRINGEAFPNITPITATLGSTQTWTIVNDSEMDHPFHLHGFFFEAIERAGVAAPYRAKQDTINVAAFETVRILVTFDGFPGTWMYHCHILEHEERGMMGELVVTAP